MVQPESCIHCQQCLKYCPTDAIAFSGQQIRLDEKRCIGCGQCAKHCKKEVFEMIFGARNVFVPTKGKKFYENTTR